MVIPTPTVLLAFEVLDFQDHLGADGAFLVEQGIGQSLLDDGADLSGDAEGDLMDRIQSMIVQDRLSCASEFQVVVDIGFGLFRGEPRHVVAHGDPLVEGFHDGKLHDPLQIGLTGEDQDEGVIGIHLEVGEEPQFFEGSGLEKMSLVNDQKDGLSRTLFGFQESLLDLTIDGTMGEPGREAEETI